MDAAIFQRVRELFHAVCELPPHERAAYLESACADEAVRRDVLALIEMDTDASDGHALLAHAPLGAHLIRSALAATEAPPPPERLGAYRILARLGSGGMGEVFGAEQDRPRRRVALKLMRAGVVSPAVQRRFALEADVLGRLQHENIARIYEAGVDHSAGERPFLAMEFIDGLPLTKHADARQLDRRARVALLAAVCDGVQHAHQRGVIHRDLKPANILVTAEGVPKILDFGIARTLDDEANLTREHHPGMILGTLAYMSPEQVQGDRDAIDTRSDVYSLGVILHELLTGRLPYDTTGLPLAQAARVISEGAPPRIADPGLRGDLETIILKALQRDRARRYGSPADLAADLRRYLAGAPILARADALGYVLSRQLRRHRVVATLGGTSLLVLIGSVIALAISYQRQTTLLHAARAARDAEAQARQAAESESARAGAISNFLQNMLTSLDPAQANGRDVTMQDYLDQAGRQLDSGTLRDRPEVEAALRSTLGKTYQALGLVSAAEHHLDRALALAEQVFGADSRPCAAVLNSLVAIYRGRGDLARAEAGGRRVVDIMRHSPQQGDYAIALGELADVCRAQRKYAEAEALCREQIRIQDTLGGAAPAPVAMAYMKLGQNLEAQQQRAAADTAYAHAVAVAREKLGHQHPVTANALDAHGSLLAESDATRARGLALMEEALGIRQAVLPPKHPEIANGITNLALALADENPARAADLSHEALRIYEAALGENDPRVAGALQTLAYAYGALGQDAAAAAAYERALRISRAAYGDKHPRVAGILHSLGVTLMNQGAHAAAEPLMREALAIRAELLGAEDPARLMSQCLLGQILEKLGRYAEAAPLAQGCYETGQRVMPPGMVPPARALWGAVLLGLGRLDEAEPHLLAAYEGYRTAPGISVTRRQALLDDLVQLYEARHQPDEAARWRAMSPETQPVEAP